MNSADISLVKRRDQLIEAIVEALRSRFQEKPLTVAEHVALQSALAHYDIETHLSDWMSAPT